MSTTVRMVTGERKSRPIMKCGCVATGRLSPVCPGRDSVPGAMCDYNPEGVCVFCQTKETLVCVPHYGIHPGATQIAPKQPDLSERFAECLYCKKVVKSSTALAFFESKPDTKYDWYYCGCRGWD